MINPRLRNVAAAILLWLAPVLVALPSNGCQRGAGAANDAPPLPSVPVRIGQQTFTLEVADDDSERQRGLMHRQSMPADHGMIFVFPNDAERQFWMKNTLIPLDILYLDADGKVVSIRQLKPLDETGVRSWFPARYAIELNEGAAKKAGVKIGHVVNIPPVAKFTGE
jgi:uncharacterized membrane protein (UPF0127 family)